MLRNLISAGYTKAWTNPLLLASTLNANQLRTTFILKRRCEVPLAKKNTKPRKMRGRHFIYELIEDQNTKAHPKMEVILTTYVESVGRKGEIVSVKPSVAYNQLLLPGFATYVTKANIEKYQQSEENVPAEEKHSSQFAQQTVYLLQRKVYAIVMNKDKPWVLEPWHIRASLRKAGFHILHDSSIKLPEQKITGPDLMKQNKEFNVTVTINNTEKAIIRCRIHHWSTDPTERLPYVFNHFAHPAEPLFGDQQTSSTDITVEK